MRPKPKIVGMFSIYSIRRYGQTIPTALVFASIKMVLHQNVSVFVVCTAFVLHLVWRNSTLTCVTIYWGNVYAGCGGTCLSLDHGLGQYACNNSSIILIVVKWSTKHSIHQKVKE